MSIRHPRIFNRKVQHRLSWMGVLVLMLCLANPSLPSAKPNLKAANNTKCVAKAKLAVSLVGLLTFSTILEKSSLSITAVRNRFSKTIDLIFESLIKPCSKDSGSTNAQPSKQSVQTTGSQSQKPAQTTGPQTFVTGDSPVDIAYADFNGDGNIDAAVANQNSDDVAILTGNPDDSFNEPVNFATGARPNSIRSGDFNN